MARVALQLSILAFHQGRRQHHQHLRGTTLIPKKETYFRRETNQNRQDVREGRL